MNKIFESQKYVKFIISERQSGKSEIARQLIRRLSKDDRLLIFAQTKHEISNYGPIFPANVFISDINDFESKLRGKSNSIIFLDNIFNYNMKIFESLVWHDFKSVYLTGTPIDVNDDLIVKKICTLFENIDFFELKRGMLKDYNEVAYKLTYQSFLKWIDRHFLRYTKFDLILEAC